VSESAGNVRAILEANRQEKQKQDQIKAENAQLQTEKHDLEDADCLSKEKEKLSIHAHRARQERAAYNSSYLLVIILKRHQIFGPPIVGLRKSFYSTIRTYLPSK
jgi:hypothetical protein